MKTLIPVEQVEKRVLLIRGQKVMLDADLAELYGVRTKVLNQAVKRNIERFPLDFMFQLTRQEKAEVVTNCDHLRRLKFSPREHEGLRLDSRRMSLHDVAVYRFLFPIRRSNIPSVC